MTAVLVALMDLMVVHASEVQEPAVGVVESPCTHLPTASVEKLAQDFGQLCRYEEANAALPAASDHRVVFLGDSITENWGVSDAPLFSNDVICRGISGQTTAQMLVRFKADVLDLKPRTVHILAGTNDIAGNTGPTTLARIQNNLMAMAEQAKAHGVHVLLGSILPAKSYNWRPSIRPSASIKAMNAWLKDYAERAGYTYVDYYSAVVDSNEGLKKSLSPDGVHPNTEGYAVMRPLVQRALIGYGRPNPRPATHHLP